MRRMTAKAQNHASVFTKEQHAKHLFHDFVVFVVLPLRGLAKLSKRCKTAAYFSKNINSFTMWSHYAYYHKEFALEYNVRSI